MASVWKRNGRGGKGKWLISYKDHTGKRRTVTGSPSKTVTKQVAAQLEDEVLLRRRGVIDPALDHYAEAEQTPLVDKDTEGQIIGGHLADFHAGIVAKGSTEKHARLTRNWAATIIDMTGAERISDLQASRVQAALQELHDHGVPDPDAGEDGDGLSLETCNHYLRAIKQFSRWLWRDKRAREDDLAHLARYNTKTDRRYQRRALTDDEVIALVDAAEQGPVVLHMAGPERVMLYRVALNTGFRANELRSLTPESFTLVGNVPTIIVEAKNSKRRRRDEQPIRRDLAAILRDWLRDKAPGQPVFNMPDKTAKMMRRDLEAAQVKHRDSAGLVADFHSLRHTFITNLERAGASVRNAQLLARHSDPKLTMNYYTHLTIANQAAVLADLPAIDGAGKVQHGRSAQQRRRAS